MKVFLAGATGFIGGHILDRLLADGHSVRACVRHPEAGRARVPSVEWLHGDFSQDREESTWLPRLAGCDAVINAVGILHETGNQKFDDLHTRGPVALFGAAAKSGIRRILQISALGADEKAGTRYHLSKRAADEFLVSLGLDHVILHPSIVIGEGAQSTGLFATLAALPLIPLPGGGHQKLQPVSIDDLTAGIGRLIGNWPEGGVRFDVVGPRPLTLSELIQQMSLEAPILKVSVPLWLIYLGASFTSVFGGGLLDREAIQMLERGSCGDPAPFEKATGLRMKSLDEFLSRQMVGGRGRTLLLSRLVPLLRLSIAFLWVWTGIVSAFLFPVAESYRWLSTAGITGTAASFALYSASAVDALLGLALLFRGRTYVYLFQFLLVVLYTGVLSFALPDLWVHPFGPLSKNIPLLAAILMGLVFDREHRSSR